MITSIIMRTKRNDGDVGSDLHDSVPSNRRSEDTVRLTGFNYHHLCLWEDMTYMGSQTSGEAPDPGLKEDMGCLLVFALIHEFLDDGHIALHDGKGHLPLLLGVLLHRRVHDQCEDEKPSHVFLQ